jgi:hypothetical protein
MKYISEVYIEEKLQKYIRRLAAYRKKSMKKYASSPDKETSEWAKGRLKSGQFKKELGKETKHLKTHAVGDAAKKHRVARRVELQSRMKS